MMRRDLSVPPKVRAKKSSMHAKGGVCVKGVCVW